MELFSPVTELRGVGERRAKLLEKLGIATVYDLLSFFPRAYEDRTRLLTISELQPDEPACFLAMVVSPPQLARVPGGREVVRVRVADETGALSLTCLNPRYRKEQLHCGERYYFYGSTREDRPHAMAAPEFEAAGAPGAVTNRILPVYSLTAGLSNRQLAALCAQALSAVCQSLPELLPQRVRQEYGLCGVQQAYAAIHAPQSQAQLHEARRRLVFEEFFIFSAGLAALRRARTARTGFACRTDMMAAFYDALPFRLTGAQQRAIADILSDLSAPRPMNRLVQGDVGSGKTMVAAAACFCAVQNGLQAAVMAPTEILAQQHADTLSRLLSPLGVRVALLTGSMTPAQKKACRQAIADGSAQLVIGTHALLTADTVFSRLGLVVADEQQRFGVAQRAVLSQKGADPHLLVMSATPIPRTLALIAYGDLDVSVIGELPPGRLPVQTFLVSERLRARVNGFIRKQCEAGRQVYVLCPAVEPGEDEGVKSVQAWAETLQKSLFPELRVALLHGRMKGAEKEAALRAFARGEADILVSTTVVEVGVDVPNATLMVVENAERFGLSQLHQLRGRVGRGQAQSWCVLISDTRNPDTRKRLAALCSCADGFQIAEQDLALRGPGDFFGSRQHGLPLFKVASLQMDMQTLTQAQQAAAACIRSAQSLDAPELAPLKERVAQLFSEQALALN